MIAFPVLEVVEDLEGDAAGLRRVEHDPLEEQRHVGRAGAGGQQGAPQRESPEQAAARALRAACTPDLFLFDAEHRLAYRGQLDGSRPGNHQPLDGRDLRAALEALLAGQPINTDQQPSIGCNIKWHPA